ncbi:MAG: cytochrome C oxidase subunit IV family protein [Chloroflexi bacterium]|nr:cytochrome C oxidase subunit IV family protein [Chloroflexota bacterium]
MSNPADLSPETNAELATDAALESRHAHPNDAQYVAVAGALAVLTAIEVAVYYLKSTNITIGVLFVLMVTKFAMVVAFFMHLRFDSRVLRRLFLGGLSLAVVVYGILFFMFGFFHV